MASRSSITARALYFIPASSDPLQHSTAQHSRVHIWGVGLCSSSVLDGRTISLTHILLCAPLCRAVYRTLSCGRTERSWFQGPSFIQNPESWQMCRALVYAAIPGPDRLSFVQVRTLNHLVCSTPNPPPLPVVPDVKGVDAARSLDSSLVQSFCPAADGQGTKNDNFVLQEADLGRQVQGFCDYISPKYSGAGVVRITAELTPCGASAGGVSLRTLEVWAHDFFFWSAVLCTPSVFILHTHAKSKETAFQLSSSLHANTPMFPFDAHIFGCLFGISQPIAAVVACARSAWAVHVATRRPHLKSRSISWSRALVLRRITSHHMTNQITAEREGLGQTEADQVQPLLNKRFPFFFSLFATDVQPRRFFASGDSESSSSSSFTRWLKVPTQSKGVQALLSRRTEPELQFQHLDDVNGLPGPFQSSATAHACVVTFEPSPQVAKHLDEHRSLSGSPHCTPGQPQIIHGSHPLLMATGFPKAFAMEAVRVLQLEQAAYAALKSPRALGMQYHRTYKSPILRRTIDAAAGTAREVLRFQVLEPGSTAARAEILLDNSLPLRAPPLGAESHVNGEEIDRHESCPNLASTTIDPAYEHGTGSSQPPEARDKRRSLVRPAQSPESRPGTITDRKHTPIVPRHYRLASLPRRNTTAVLLAVKQAGLGYDAIAHPRHAGMGLALHSCPAPAENPVPSLPDIQLAARAQKSTDMCSSLVTGRFVRHEAGVRSTELTPCGSERVSDRRGARPPFPRSGEAAAQSTGWLSASWKKACGASQGRWVMRSGTCEKHDRSS
ncbi:hypothetical protein JHW43_002578 [Diplocarpon mali]|nr:hypothetical protein JHW43_002578 [Diplocarpon mali]